MNRFLFFVLLVICNITKSQNCSWIRDVAGQVPGSTESANNFVIDNSGNFVVVGAFNFSSDFDPTSGVNILASNSNTNTSYYGSGYLSKYDSLGNCLWAKRTIVDCISEAVAVDSLDNIYVGTSGDTLLKYSATGNLIWKKPLTGWEVHSIKYYKSGCFYLGLKGHWLNAGNIGVAKIDMNGNVIWLKQFVGFYGSGGQQRTHISVNQFGETAVFGVFYGTKDFDLGPSTYTLTSSGAGSQTDYFVLKLDANGNFMWVKSLIGDGFIVGEFNSAGDIYISGRTGVHVVDLDTSPNTSNFGDGVNCYSYLCKWNGSGDFIWAGLTGILAGCNPTNFLYNPMSIDMYDNIYTTSGKGDVDPGVGVYNVNGNSIGIIKFNNLNQFVWVKSWPAGGIPLPKAIHAKKNGEIISCGLTAGSIQLEDVSYNGYYSHIIPIDQYSDAYLFSIHPFNFEEATIKNNVCYNDAKGEITITSFGGTPPFNYYWSNGVTTNTNTITGLSSLATYSVLVKDSKGACFIVNNGLYVSGPFFPFTVNVNTTNENCVGAFNNGTATIDTVNSNGRQPYTFSWNTSPSQHSITATNLSQGVYNATVTDNNGCVATCTANISKTLSPAVFSYTTNNMTANFNIIGSGCNSFIWDFGNGNTSSINPSPIVTYLTPGTYGVCLLCNGMPTSCVQCLNITIPSNTSGAVGLIENQNQNDRINIYPNPGNGVFTINSEDLKFSNENYEIKLFDMFGRNLQVNSTYDLKNNTIKFNMLNPSAGFYYLYFKYLESIYVAKIIVQ